MRGCKRCGTPLDGREHAPTCMWGRRGRKYKPGMRFGSLTLIRQVAPSDGWRNSRWLTRCDCGRKATRSPTAFVKEGGPKCRHCWKKTLPKWGGVPVMATRARTKLYATWRLNNARLCPAWRKDFSVFFDAVAATRPRRGRVSLVPINTARPIGPNNFRWTQGTAAVEQLVPFKGESLTVMEWARRFGVSRQMLSFRIERWGVERALSTPFRKRRSA